MTVAPLPIAQEFLRRGCRLGDILGEPRVGLLFVDFHEGSVAQLQGLARVDRTGGGTEAAIGAERVWSVDVERGWWREHAVDVVWHDLEPR